MSICAADHVHNDVKIEEQVVFNVPKNIPIQDDVAIQYVLQHPGTPLDWIGIFSSGFKDIGQPLMLQWAPSKATDSVNPLKRTITFPACQLQILNSDSMSYQFVYVDKDTNILGVSSKFTVTQGTSPATKHFSHTTKLSSPASKLCSLEVSYSWPESPVILSSDEEWELASPSPSLLDSSISDLSDIVVLSTSPSKETLKNNADISVSTVVINAGNETSYQQSDFLEIHSHKESQELLEIPSHKESQDLLEIPSHKESQDLLEIPSHKESQDLLEIPSHKESQDLLEIPSHKESQDLLEIPSHKESQDCLELPCHKEKKKKANKSVKIKCKFMGDSKSSDTETNQETFRKRKNKSSEENSLHCKKFQPRTQCNIISETLTNQCEQQTKHLSCRRVSGDAQSKNSSKEVSDEVRIDLDSTEQTKTVQIKKLKRRKKVCQDEVVSPSIDSATKHKNKLDSDHCLDDSINVYNQQQSSNMDIISSQSIPASRAKQLTVTSGLTSKVGNMSSDQSDYSEITSQVHNDCTVTNEKVTSHVHNDCTVTNEKVTSHVHNDCTVTNEKVTSHVHNDCTVTNEKVTSHVHNDCTVTNEKVTSHITNDSGQVISYSEVSAIFNENNTNEVIPKPKTKKLLRKKAGNRSVTSSKNIHSLPEHKNMDEQKILVKKEGKTEQIIFKKKEITTEHIISKNKENVTEQIISEKKENVTEQIISEKKENVTEQIISEKKENVTEQIISEKKENVTEQIISEKKENVTKQIISEKKENVTEQIISNKKENMTEQIISEKKENTQLFIKLSNQEQNLYSKLVQQKQIPEQKNDVRAVHRWKSTSKPNVQGKKKKKAIRVNLNIQPVVTETETQVPVIEEVTEVMSSSILGDTSDQGFPALTTRDGCYITTRRDPTVVSLSDNVSPDESLDISVGQSSTCAKSSLQSASKLKPKYKLEQQKKKLKLVRQGNSVSKRNLRNWIEESMNELKAISSYETNLFHLSMLQNKSSPVNVFDQCTLQTAAKPVNVFDQCTLQTAAKPVNVFDQCTLQTAAKPVNVFDQFTLKTASKPVNIFDRSINSWVKSICPTGCSTFQDVTAVHSMTPCELYNDTINETNHQLNNKDQGKLTLSYASVVKLTKSTPTDCVTATGVTNNTDIGGTNNTDIGGTNNTGIGGTNNTDISETNNTDFDGTNNTYIGGTNNTYTYQDANEEKMKMNANEEHIKHHFGETNVAQIADIKTRGEYVEPETSSYQPLDKKCIDNVTKWNKSAALRKVVRLIRRRARLVKLKSEINKTTATCQVQEYLSDQQHASTHLQADQQYVQLRPTARIHGAITCSDTRKPTETLKVYHVEDITSGQSKNVGRLDTNQLTDTLFETQETLEASSKVTKDKAQESLMKKKNLYRSKALRADSKIFCLESQLKEKFLEIQSLRHQVNVLKTLLADRPHSIKVDSAQTVNRSQLDCISSPPMIDNVHQIWNKKFCTDITETCPAVCNREEKMDSQTKPLLDTKLNYVVSKYQDKFSPPQFTRSPPQQFTRSPPQQFTRSPPQQFTRSPPQQFIRSPPQQFTRSPPQQFTRSPPSHFKKSAPQQLLFNTNSPTKDIQRCPILSYQNEQKCPTYLPEQCYQNPLHNYPNNYQVTTSLPCHNTESEMKYAKMANPDFCISPRVNQHLCSAPSGKQCHVSTNSHHTTATSSGLNQSQTYNRSHSEDLGGIYSQSSQLENIITSCHKSPYCWPSHTKEDYTNHYCTMMEASPITNNCITNHYCTMMEASPITNNCITMHPDQANSSTSVNKWLFYDYPTSYVNNTLLCLDSTPTEVKGTSLGNAHTDKNLWTENICLSPQATDRLDVRKHRDQQYDVRKHRDQQYDVRKHRDQQYDVRKHRDQQYGSYFLNEMISDETNMKQTVNKIERTEQSKLIDWLKQPTKPLDTNMLCSDLLLCNNGANYPTQEVYNADQCVDNYYSVGKDIKSNMMRLHSRHQPTCCSYELTSEPVYCPDTKLDSTTQYTAQLKRLIEALEAKMYPHNK